MNIIQRVRNKFHFLWHDRAFRSHPLRSVLRIAAWRGLCIFGREVTIHFKPGIRMKLIPAWRGNAKMIYAFREDYESDLVWVSERLRPGMICIDGGAALGIWTLTMARLVGPAGRVIAFEPSRQMFDILRENVRINGFDNVVLLNKALGDQDKAVKLFHSHETIGGFSLEAGSGVESETVEMTTLHTALQGLGISRVDFMKLDLEGAEGMVMRTSTDLLNGDHPPLIMYEQHSEAQAALSNNPAEAWSVLSNLGYRQYRLDFRDLRLIPLREPVDGGNVIALPPGNAAE